MALRIAGGQLGLDNEFDFWKPTKVTNLQGDGMVFAADARSEVEWKVLQLSCGLNHSAAIVEITE